jgi:parallel beta-helix repeat protein
MKSDWVTQIKEWVLVSIIVPLLVFFSLCLGAGFFMTEAMANDLSRGTLIEVECGQKLGPNGHYKLANDLLCPCDTDDSNVEPAITIEGPVTVDLNGKSIACEPCDAVQCKKDCEEEICPYPIPIPPLYSIAGIHVKGEGATVRNGTIIRCNVGLVVGGVDDLAEDTLKGHHKIINVTVLASQEVLYYDEDECNNFKGDGIILESTHNYAGRNELLGNQNDGIDLKAGYNLIKKNSSIGNGGKGYNIEGDHNWLIGNQARINVDDGIEVEGGVGTRMIRNKAIANGGRGIELKEETPESSIKFNEASANNKEGIRLRETSNFNFIKYNKVIANENEGIRVDKGAEYNTIEYNKAILNGDDDLRDKNDECDNNIWRRNTFNTSNPAECIQ